MQLMALVYGCNGSLGAAIVRGMRRAAPAWPIIGQAIRPVVCRASWQTSERARVHILSHGEVLTCKPTAVRSAKQAST